MEIETDIQSRKDMDNAIKEVQKLAKEMGMTVIIAFDKEVTYREYLREKIKQIFSPVKNSWQRLILILKSQKAGLFK